MKTTLALALRVIVLTIVMLICFAAAASVVMQPDTAQTPEQASAAAQALAVVCLLNTLVLTYVILRSRWRGWRLMTTIFVVIYGVTTVMTQIESAVFVTTLPPGMLPRLFLMGALIAAPFSVLAVVILGKPRPDTSQEEPNSRLVMPAREWTWKLALIAIAYVTLYFTFGHFIAWQNPELRAYYGAADPVTFVDGMRRMLGSRPWLIPFQVLRAMMWVAIALPVIRMMKGNWLETALALGLLFGVLMNAQLLLPNPYMPASVRMSHLMEIVPSNFLFGVLVGWLLTRRHVGVRQSGIDASARAA